jgi:ABC-type Fe3+ transport system permease subunit
VVLAVALPIGALVCVVGIIILVFLYKRRERQKATTQGTSQQFCSHWLLICILACILVLLRGKCIGAICMTFLNSDALVTHEPKQGRPGFLEAPCQTFKEA